MQVETARSLRGRASPAPLAVVEVLMRGGIGRSAWWVRFTPHPGLCSQDPVSLHRCPAFCALMLLGWGVGL